MSSAEMAALLYTTDIYFFPRVSVRVRCRMVRL